MAPTARITTNTGGTRAPSLQAEPALGAVCGLVCPWLGLGATVVPDGDSGKGATGGSGGMTGEAAAATGPGAGAGAGDGSWADASLHWSGTAMELQALGRVTASVRLTGTPSGTLPVRRRHAQPALAFTSADRDRQQPAVGDGDGDEPVPLVM